jgi:uncharacterized protein with LGFP repeats
MGDGRGQVSWFEGGAIFWTAATGPHHVQNPPLTFWFQQGGPRTFGYPTGNHTVFPNGTIEQRFERATVVIRDDVGTRTVIGGINAKYVELGAVGGALGVPLTDELSMGDGRGRVSWFEAGGIFWTATTGAHEVRNPILTEWFNRGGPGNPSYGYPISDVEQVAVGVTRVRFEHGTITYNSVTDSFS